MRIQHIFNIVCRYQVQVVSSQSINLFIIAPNIQFTFKGSDDVGIEFPALNKTVTIAADSELIECHCI